MYSKSQFNFGTKPTEYPMDCFSDFISLLSEADRIILLAANSLHTPTLDSLMWEISRKWTWVPLYILLSAFVFRKYNTAGGIVCLLIIAAMITATDQTCAGIIRPVVCRLRPSSPDNPLSSLLHLVNDYRGGRFGFPSCHAANTFALALFLSLLFKNRLFTIAIISWSLLVSYSRIYLGVHYPSDILGGLLIGALFAILSHSIMIYSSHLFLRSLSVNKT